MDGGRAGVIWAFLMVFTASACAESGADQDDGSGLDEGAGGSEAAAGGGGGASAVGGQGAADSVGGSDAGSSVGPHLCPSDPAMGIEVGQQLPDIVVKDCEGRDYSLSELCGAAGLWVFAAHGWCPLCQTVSGFQEALTDQHDGLRSVTIIVEDGQLQPPDEAYCAAWRDEHGHEDVITLFDPTGASLALWPNGSSSLHAFVDGQRLIHSKLEYTSNQAAIEAEIQEIVP